MIAIIPRTPELTVFAKINIFMKELSTCKVALPPQTRAIEFYTRSQKTTKLKHACQGFTPNPIYGEARCGGFVMFLAAKKGIS